MWASLLLVLHITIGFGKLLPTTTLVLLLTCTNNVSNLWYVSDDELCDILSANISSYLKSNGTIEYERFRGASCLERICIELARVVCFIIVL